MNSKPLRYDEIPCGLINGDPAQNKDNAGRPQYRQPNVYRASTRGMSIDTPRFDDDVAQLMEWTLPRLPIREQGDLPKHPVTANELRDFHRDASSADIGADASRAKPQYIISNTIRDSFDIYMTHLVSAALINDPESVWICRNAGRP